MDTMHYGKTLEEALYYISGQYIAVKQKKENIPNSLGCWARNNGWTQYCWWLIYYLYVPFAC